MQQLSDYSYATQASGYFIHTLKTWGSPQCKKQAFIITIQGSCMKKMPHLGFIEIFKDIASSCSKLGLCVLLVERRNF